ncbi:DUF4280 domain-containing protein [Chryseobacterium salipaludis]|uniref:PAAR-like protein n=1 Tax=Chryseobacterium TaxID=59732 RepID=UPI001FF225C6|nr:MULTISPECIES: PAAR-like protein [Chryseobacterium]MCJ8498297.1 DUF4280 domain-containing protein [Chryseobacterium salipaludis]MCX3297457.1 PAAR-like protein [Planobacterium sp. JC490]
MSKYLPQESFIVCSHQVNPSPGVLLADPNLWKLSVIYKAEQKPLLTEADKILKEDFECKSNWGQAAGWGFFFGGLIAGLAIAAAVAFSVLTFGVGAIIIGVLATAAIGTGVTLALASNSTKCNPNLVEWVNSHSKVKFENNKALTQKSFLTCSAGPGILTPFIDETEAKSAAKNISFRNMGEISLTAAISGLFGFTVGYTGGTALAGGGLGAGLLAGGKEIAVGVVGAYLVYQPVSSLESKGMQSLYGSKNGDQTYDELLDARRDLENSFVVDTPDDPYIGTSQTTAVGNIKDHSFDLYRQKQNEKYIKEIMNLKGTRAEREARTAEIVAEMKKTRSGSEAVEAMKRRNSGKIYPRERTSRKGISVINQHKSETTKAIKSEAAKGFSGMNAVGLILPLLVSPVSEWTFSVLADSFASQSGGGMTINSTQN